MPLLRSKPCPMPHSSSSLPPCLRCLELPATALPPTPPMPKNILCTILSSTCCSRRGCVTLHFKLALMITLTLANPAATLAVTLAVTLVVKIAVTLAVTLAVTIAVTLAVTLAVTIAVTLAVTLAVTIAVTLAVTLSVTIAVTLAVTIAVTLAAPLAVTLMPFHLQVILVVYSFMLSCCPGRLLFPSFPFLGTAFSYNT
ncbi:unnamed protein product [Closterium sp. NIES-65]|nr:unnamed protein product [Closterium sp. NIES-65]